MVLHPAWQAIRLPAAGQLALANLGEMVLDFASLVDPEPASVLCAAALDLCRASFFSAGLDMLGTVPVMHEEVMLGLILENFPHYETVLCETVVLVADLRAAGRNPKLLEAIRRVCFAMEQALDRILRIWEQVLRPSAAAHADAALRRIDRILHAIGPELRQITAKASHDEPALDAAQRYPAVLKREKALKNRPARQEMARIVRRG